MPFSSTSLGAGRTRSTPSSRRWIRVVVVALLLSSAAPALASQTVYELKAAYVARFTEFIEWPTAAGATSAASDSVFRVCVFGEHPIAEPLAKLPQLLRTHGTAITFRRITTPADASQCAILFIAHESAATLAELRRHIADKPVLTVSDAFGKSHPNVLINFFVENERLRFSVDLAAAREAGFVISSRLLKLAVVVGAPP